jgi:hypothetical protein
MRKRVEWLTPFFSEQGEELGESLFVDIVGRTVAVRSDPVGMLFT